MRRSSSSSAFSLEGRAIRKIRQSVSRLTKAGYSAELARAGRARRGDARSESSTCSSAGREGAPGARLLDGDGLDPRRARATRRSCCWRAIEQRAIKGVLHFVPATAATPCRCRSCAATPETPNGLTEFLVVKAVELLRERGLGEMSLNFAAFAKWIHSPEKRSERVLGKLVTLGNPFFQIESLYRFNAKFFPRWEPRYLVYEGTFGLPRAGIAALWAEGQLWKPSIGSS